MSNICTVTGNITDLGIEPAEGVTVTFTIMGRGLIRSGDAILSPDGIKSVKTLADGSFTVTLASNQIYSVTVMARNGATRTSRGVIEQGEETLAFADMLETDPPPPDAVHTVKEAVRVATEAKKAVSEDRATVEGTLLPQVLGARDTAVGAAGSAADSAATVAGVVANARAEIEETLFAYLTHDDVSVTFAVGSAIVVSEDPGTPQFPFPTITVEVPV